MTIRLTLHPLTLATLLAASFPSVPALAQDLLLSPDPMAQARAAMARNDPAEALSRYLRVLAARPKDLDALMGAGRAALDIGDPSAAIGFYARAEEVAPRNGRVKAGLGSAMVQMENPRAALKLFDEATDLDVPAADIAADRGLAYDLRGDNKRAQQDYALALRSGEDAETRRRLALSQAMSGDRVAALATLDPLLRRQDVPAWRVRAFVLALTGDAAGAEKSALSVLPGPQAAALLPFLARLPALRPEQQAAAVHFGHFPSDGRQYSSNELLAGASPMPRSAAPRSDAGLIPSGAPLGRGGTSATPSQPVSTAPRRRPGAIEETIVPKPVKAPKPEATPVRIVAPPKTVIKAEPPATAGGPSTGHFAGPPAPPPEERLPAVVSAPTPTPAPRLLLDPGFMSVLREARLAEAEASASKPRPVAPLVKAKEPVTKTKDIAKTAEAKTVDADKTKTNSKVKEVAKSKDDSKAKLAAKDEKADKKDAKAGKGKAPERYWVQVAGGANKADLPKAYARLKDKSPKLFAGQSAWTTPLRATNRLLVGPFKTFEEAQGFVNKAGKESLPAFSFKSEAGQEVEKLSAK